jgi:hypothetical protein
LFVLVLVRIERRSMVDVGEYPTDRTADASKRKASIGRSWKGLPAVVYIAEFGKDAAWT